MVARDEVRKRRLRVRRPFYGREVILGLQVLKELGFVEIFEIFVRFGIVNAHVERRVRATSMSRVRLSITISHTNIRETHSCLR